jgi:uncharacterized repeat protein (TIGR01451 family)
VVNIGNTPNSGFQFGGWSGPVNGSTVTMTGPITIAANFQQLASVTVNTSPAGLTFLVDGVVYAGSQTLTWVSGSPHSIVAAAQAGAAGTLYAFTSWSDGGSGSHNVTAPGTASALTAIFTTQYQLTTSAGGGGSVSPGAGSYYNAGSTVSVTATAIPGFQFAGWSGPVSNPSSPTTTVVMSSPIAISAGFQALLPDLTISQSHSGNFTQGQTGALYTVLVANIGTGTALGPVIVTEAPAAGLNLVSLSGVGWTCPAGTFTCTRSDALAPSAVYPPITVTVNVAANAVSAVLSSATVAGGSEVNTGNDSATDPTTIAGIVSQVLDVTSQIKWSGTGLSLNRASGLLTGTVTITNIGATPVSAPLQAVITNLIQGATLANPTGNLLSGSYAGAPYITVAGSTALAPGASVTVPVKFSYSGTAPISYMLKVLSGAL